MGQVILATNWRKFHYDCCWSDRQSKKPDFLKTPIRAVSDPMDPQERALSDSNKESRQRTASLTIPPLWRVLEVLFLCQHRKSRAVEGD